MGDEGAVEAVDMIDECGVWSVCVVKVIGAVGGWRSKGRGKFQSM
jgi:hypothetical protein